MSALSSEDSLESDKSEEMKAKLALSSFWSIAQQHDQSARDGWDFIGSRLNEWISVQTHHLDFDTSLQWTQRIYRISSRSAKKERKRFECTTNAQDNIHTEKNEISVVFYLKNNQKLLLLRCILADGNMSLFSCSSERSRLNRFQVGPENLLENLFPRQWRMQKPRYSLKSRLRLRRERLKSVVETVEVLNHGSGISYWILILWIR